MQMTSVSHFEKENVFCKGNIFQVTPNITLHLLMHWEF